MKWRPYDLSPHDSCPEARMGHTATLIDTEDVWGEKLLIIYGTSDCSPCACLNYGNIWQCPSRSAIRQPWLEPADEVCTLPQKIDQQDINAEKIPWKRQSWRVFKRLQTLKQMFRHTLSPCVSLAYYLLFLGAHILHSLRCNNFAGGLGADKRALDDLYVFQVQSQAWICPKVANKGPSARAFHCAAAVGRCLYVFGGHVYHKDRAVHKFADLWCLDTVSVSSNWSFTWANMMVTVWLIKNTNLTGFLAVTRSGVHRTLVKATLFQVIWLWNTALFCRNEVTLLASVKQATWEWAEVSWDSSLPSPCARDFFALLALPGRLLLFAGLDSNDKKLDDTWEFFVEG